MNGQNALETDGSPTLVPFSSSWRLLITQWYYLTLLGLSKKSGSARPLGFRSPTGLPLTHMDLLRLPSTPRICHVRLFSLLWTAHLVTPPLGSRNQPTVLFTHIPLFRPRGTSCGPLREHGTIRDGSGYGYENTLDPLTSEWILKGIRPSIIFR